MSDLLRNLDPEDWPELRVEPATQHPGMFRWCVTWRGEIYFCGFNRDRDNAVKCVNAAYRMFCTLFPEGAVGHG